MTNEHTSLEKYTSHTLFERVAKGLEKGCERVVCERWVGDWTDCNILTPSSSDYGSTSFSFCWAAQPGVLRVQALCWELVSLPRTATRTPTNWHQITRTVCGIGLYNCLNIHLLLVDVAFAPNSTRQGCTCFLIDGWSKVNMLQKKCPRYNTKLNLIVRL